jgi:hypothetical protein
MHPIHRLNSNESGEALKNQNTETGIHVLPDEILRQIFNRLPPKSLSKMGGTSKFYREISKAAFQTQKEHIKIFLNRILEPEIAVPSFEESIDESKNFSLLKEFIEQQIGRRSLFEAIANKTLFEDLPTIELLHELIEPSPILYLTSEFCSKLPQETVDKLADMLPSMESLAKLTDKFFDIPPGIFGVFSHSRKLILEALKGGFECLEFASDRLKNDKEIVLAAVKQNGLALDHASDELKNDREIVLAAVKQNGLALDYASDELKNDKEIVLAAVEQNGLALSYASEELKNDKEIVLAAVEQNGLALNYASDELKNDKEIVLAAVKQNGLALNYALDELKNDKEIVSAAVDENPRALIYASPLLQRDQEFEQFFFLTLPPRDHFGLYYGEP